MQSYSRPSDGINKKGDALSCVINESNLEESNFGDFSEGRPLGFHSLSNIRRNNINRLILAHININSIRNKFAELVDVG